MSQCAAPGGLLPWALAELGADAGARPELVAVAGDASARRYFRFRHEMRRYVVAEAPPATEKNTEFADIARLLRSAGINAPCVYALDPERGFLLLEDLGDQLLLPLLDEDSVDHWYGEAFDVLLSLSRIGLAQPRAVPARYDRELLGEELGRFPQWFVEGLLGVDLTAGDRAVLAALDTLLVDSALSQPRVLVHRDFHSRNLMVTEGGLAVIDFQDAVMGPVTYDLVSLLRDCYVRWPADRVRAWALDYRARALAAGVLAPVDDREFLRWFDWMGLQRHLKVLGTFARLHLRDGKDSYLADLPLVLRYIDEALAAYRDAEPVIAAFGGWFAERLAPVIARQPWSARP